MAHSAADGAAPRVGAAANSLTPSTLRPRIHRSTRGIHAGYTGANRPPPDDVRPVPPLSPRRALRRRWRNPVRLARPLGGERHAHGRRSGRVSANQRSCYTGPTQVVSPALLASRNGCSRGGSGMGVTAGAEDPKVLRRRVTQARLGARLPACGPPPSLTAPARVHPGHPRVRADGQDHLRAALPGRTRPAPPSAHPVEQGREPSRLASLDRLRQPRRTPPPQSGYRDTQAQCLNLVTNAVINGVFWLAAPKRR